MSVQGDKLLGDKNMVRLGGKSSNRLFEVFAQWSNILEKLPATNIALSSINPSPNAA